MPSSVKLTDGGVTYYAQWTANAQSKISPHHGKNINGSKSKLPKYGGTKIKSIFGFRINVDWFSCRIIWWIKKMDYHQIIRHKMNYILENALLVPTKLNISLKKILNYFLLKKSKKR
ncbi:hypothetical protein BW152_12250 [Lactococcus lactis]|nr:hypothetical protein BW152_12250 [Lactococcus lactis]